MLLLTDSFLKKEFKPLKRYYTIDDLKKTVAKVDKSAVCLGSLGYKNGKLLKLRMAGLVAGRLIVYVFVQKETIMPLVLRLKSDKVFGQNLSLNNKRGKNLILKMLDLAMDDVKHGYYRKENL